MSEVLTLEGLRKLLEMKIKGEKLPENCEEPVRNYIQTKIKLVEKWRQQYEKENEQLKEALSIAAALNIPIILRCEDG